MAKSTKSAADAATASDLLMLPWNTLVRSDRNVRHVPTGNTDGEFVADIKRRGILQSLLVKPMLDDSGQLTGKFEVTAGGRRYDAVGVLVGEGYLPIDTPVPCRVKNSEIIEDDSLAENIQRAPLHPLDQYRAFVALVERGLSEDEIAASFFVSVTVVRQRLKMATVSPVILDAFSRDELALEQLMAFTVNPNHERQDQVWEALSKSRYGREPYHIRRLLTENTVDADDKRAIFVGLDAYVEAGGYIARDLFQEDHGGWLQEPVLLDRLVRDKLEAEGATVQAEGWLWVDIKVDHGYGHTDGLRKLVGKPVDLTEEEKAKLDTLTTSLEALTKVHEDSPELPDEVDIEFAELEDQIEALQNRPAQFAPDDVARGGVFVSIDRFGQLRIERGYVRPEDEPAPELPDGSGAEGDEHPDSPAAAANSDNETITPPGLAEEDEDELKPLSDRLLSDLTAYRTVALRNAVANHPDVALTLLLHKLCCDRYYRADGLCLEARVSGPSLYGYNGLSDAPAAEAIETRNQAWHDAMPGNGTDLWTWLTALGDASRLGLLAHCVSYGVNGIYQKPDRFGGSGPSPHTIQARMHNADLLAQAVSLDMNAVGWRLTATTYFGQVSKAHIRAAVAEAKGDDAERRISGMSKADMASEAETLLADTGWLPKVLRTPAQVDTATGAPTEQIDVELQPGALDGSVDSQGDALQAAE